MSGIDQSLLIEPDYVNLRMSLVDDLDGDFRAAIVLQRLYWRMERWPEGYRTTMEDLAAEVHMPKRTTETAVAKLRDRGYLGSHREDKYNPTLTFRVILSGQVAAESAVTEAAEPAGTEAAEMAVTSSQTGETKNETPTAQTLIAEWIEHCSVRPPSRVIGQVAKEVGVLLADGFEFPVVRQALGTWHRRSLHPSALASVLQEVVNPPTESGRPRGDRVMDAARAAADELRRRGQAVPLGIEA